jgi:RNA polymerase sigma-70 factor (ECF subfamily)
MVASILDGDTELYHDLIRPYEHSVYSMALSFMKNESDAEDVAQETFLKGVPESWTVPRAGEVQHTAH